MLFKIVCLLAISASLGFKLQTTPEELNTYFQDVFDHVTNWQHEAMIEIRDALMPLEVSCQDWRKLVFANLTTAAKPYWTQIAKFEADAEEKGQDITECINLGNSQLYALNDTVIIPIYDQVDYWCNKGNSSIYESSSQAYSAVEELIMLEKVVLICSDDTCATDLLTIVKKFYERAKNIIEDAETKSYNIANIYLPAILASYQFDSDSYVQNYTTFLNDVANCIETV